MKHTFMKTHVGVLVTWLTWCTFTSEKCDLKWRKFDLCLVGLKKWYFWFMGVWPPVESKPNKEWVCTHCLWFVLLWWHLFWISESSPFLSSIQESLSRLLLQMPSKYTFTELMDKWVKLYILTNICLNFLIVLLYFL